MALPPQSREAWLAALAPEDAALREPLQRLLTLSETETGRLETLPPIEPGGPAPRAAPIAKNRARKAVLTVSIA